jgi:sterol 3beta-glucosyltransferase
MAKLQPRQREALIATLYQEKAPEVVAAQMGLSENAFRQLLFRARGAFRKALVGEAETQGMRVSEILSLAARKAAKELGVLRHEPDLTLCPVSQALVPQPADWPSHALVTGAWTSPTVGTIDTELQEFRASGPVVYAGFGSMKDSRGAGRATVIVEAARLLGFKTLLVTGWGGLEPSSAHVDAPDVMVRSTVPHSEVLPQVAVAIHHGGAGTTHAMIASGVPSVIMPFLADQPWWAARLKHLGLGPGAVPRSLTNPTTLNRALVGAIERGDAVRTAAEFMALEDGLGRALGIIEEAEAGVQDLRPAT